MEFSRKKIILIVLFVTILVGAGVWFFIMRDTKVPASVTETPSEVPVQETFDQIRVRQINLIKQSIENGLKRGLLLPEPKNAIYFKFGEILLGIQGRIPDDLYEKIGLNKLRDPKTNESYFYALAPDGKTFEVLAFLEGKSFSDYLFGESPVYRAGTKEALFLTDVEGNLLISRELDAKLYDLSNMTTRQNMGFETLKSCNQIYNFDTKGTPDKPKSGVYTIDINGIETKVFCDMQTDGGGWTLFYANNGYEDSKIKMSYVEMREALKENIFDISSYDDQYLTGLLPFRHFTALGAKEVLIRNRSGDQKNWVKFTFSTARALEWSLGPAVLGKTEYGCIDLPRKATWSVVSNDKKVFYENLFQMMNHGGASWGVSHEKYFCNTYEISKNPHLGFYHSTRNEHDWRARSNEGVTGDWGSDNQYRYFIR